MGRWTGLAAVMLWAAGAGALAQQRQGAPVKRGQQEQKPAAAPLCPVMGDPVNFLARTMLADGPVYFCCPKCIEKVKQDPDKYRDKIAAQHALLASREHVQVTCPLSGKAVDPAVYTRYRGQKVYFCCAKCKGKFEADPDKYRGKLLGSYSYQTRCPVSGRRIDRQVSLEVPGGKIYFCCKGCPARFKQNPERYLKNLEKQGVQIDADKLKSGKSPHKHGHGEDRPGGHAHR